jgi:hypothetical protein
MQNFRNVDLELRAHGDLSELLRTLEASLTVVSSDPSGVGSVISLQLRTEPTDPESAIRAISALLDHLPPAAQAMWKTTHRTFTIGFCGVPTGTTSFALSPEILALIARHEAALTCVVYSPKRES